MPLLFFSTGPSVLEVFNTLLRHLKISVEISIREKHRAKEERHFQEAVINTIGGEITITYLLIYLFYLGIFILMNNLLLLVLIEATARSLIIARSFQVTLPTIFPTTRRLRSWCSSWGRCPYQGIGRKGWCCIILNILFSLFWLHFLLIL